MKKLFKIGIVLFTFIMCFNLFSSNSKTRASNININSANLYTIGYCGQLLKYNGVIVKTHYIEYNLDGIVYPAYCLDKTLEGVTEEKPYSVMIENNITDIKLWQTIINGYPYKSLEELGVATKEEAFTATKQAVYCYIHGNDINKYEGIGEAGNRTLNALKQIVNNSQSSMENQTQGSATITAENEEWLQDSIDENYISKTYKINSNIQLKKLNIFLEENFNKEIKIVTLENEEKTEFQSEESFKIVIPIKSLQVDGEFKIKLEAEIKTKPILYGKAPNTNLQDYALTGYMYEEFSNNLLEQYLKNETKIKIIKQDSNSKIKIQDVEFRLLDKNENILLENLVTDKNGAIVIENLIPGTYYLQETKTPKEYINNDRLIPVEVLLNQELEVVVENEKEKIKEPIKEAEVVIVKKLPVTGM